MSVRIEWVDMDHPFFGMTWVPAGESVVEGYDDDEDRVPAGQVALVLSYDEVVVLVGRTDVMRERLSNALALLDAMGEGL